MAVFKRLKLIIPITALIIVLIATVLYFCPISAIYKLHSRQVVSMGFAGEEAGEIFFKFSDKHTKDMTEVLKSAELKGFPRKKFEGMKGGAPTFTTCIILSDGSFFDVSYVRTEPLLLVIDGWGYTCDATTIDAYTVINNECEKLFNRED